MSEPTYIDCECYDIDHVIRFWPNTDYKGLESLVVEIRLHHYMSWWKRLRVGIKYIFGITNCKYGHFCATQLDRQRVVKLCNLFNQFINECN